MMYIIHVLILCHTNIVVPEAFTLLLYENGYMDWVWMQNEAGTSDTSNGGWRSDGLDYLYMARTRELTSSNRGRSRSGMLKYNAGLYSKVKEDRLRDNGVFGEDYKEHWIEKGKMRQKQWHDHGGNLKMVAVSDDLGDLLNAVDSSDGDGQSEIVQIWKGVWLIQDR
jgi:hypothetical protein